MVFELTGWIRYVKLMRKSRITAKQQGTLTYLAIAMQGALKGIPYLAPQMRNIPQLLGVLTAGSWDLHVVQMSCLAQGCILSLGAIPTSSDCWARPYKGSGLLPKLGTSLRSHGCSQTPQRIGLDFCLPLSNPPSRLLRGLATSCVPQ